MLSLWLAIPSWIRMTLAILLIGFGITQTVASAMKKPSENKDPVKRIFENRQRQSQMYMGFLGIGFGLILLVTAGKSRAQKNGYSTFD